MKLARAAKQGRQKYLIQAEAQQQEPATGPLRARAKSGRYESVFPASSDPARGVNLSSSSATAENFAVAAELLG